MVRWIRWHSHRIRNVGSDDLKQSTLHLGHDDSSQFWICTCKRGRTILFLWSLIARVGGEPGSSDVTAGSNYTPHASCTVVASHRQSQRTWVVTVRQAWQLRLRYEWNTICKLCFSITHLYLLYGSGLFDVKPITPRFNRDSVRQILGTSACIVVNIGRPWSTCLD